MPAGFSGDVFSLSGDAQYEGQWNGLTLLRANAGVDVRTTLDATAQLCHGLHLSLKANATAEAEAALSMFVAARAEGMAFAQAGANLKVTLTPNLFDRVGLTLDAGAFAEAAVAGRLSIGLDLGQIAELGELALRQEFGSDLAYAIFEAFLDELEIGAGVWGRAAFSAMARAHLQVYGTLADEDRAGFVFELGASVGLKGGTGWDFFGEARLRDPRRFYGRCVRLITDEIVERARAELDPEYDLAIELLDLTLPIAMHAAYELGQRSVAAALATPQQSIRPFVEATFDQLQRYVTRKIGAYADRVLDRLVSELALRVFDRNLKPAERDELIDQVTQLIELLGDGNVEFEELPPIIAAVVEIVELLAPDEVELYLEPLTLTWTAFASLHVTANVAASASVGASFLGFGAGVSTTQADFLLPEPPGAVRAVYDEFFGGISPDVLQLSDGIDYMVSTGVSPLLDEHVPEAGAVLDRLEATFGVTSGDVVTAILVGGLHGDLTTTTLYQKLREFVSDGVDEEIEQRLIPAFASAIGPSADANLYMREVARPCVLGLKNFVFERLDGVVAGQVLEAFTESMKQAASTLVYKAFARNVVVLGFILKAHVLKEMHRSIGELETTVRSGEALEFIESASALMQASLPALAAHPTPTPESIQTLLGELLGAGREAFGPAVWSPARLEELRLTMLEALLNEDQGVDYSSPDALEQLFLALLDCDTRPNEAALARLASLLGAVTLEELEIVVRRVLPAFAEFYLALTADQVAALDATARELIDEIARRIQALLDDIERLRQAIEEQLALIEEALDEFADRLALVSGRLGSASGRTLVLDQLYAQGAQAVVDGVADVTPGWDLLDDGAKQLALGAPLAAYAMAFGAARPLLDAGLAVLGSGVVPLEDLVRGAVDLPGLVVDFGDALVAQARLAIEDQLAAAGVTLPAEITVDQAAGLAKDLLITDELEDFLRQALEFLADEREARNAEAELKAQEVLAQEQRRLEAERQDALRGGRLEASILSPANLESVHAASFVYPARVPVHLVVEGVNPTFVESGSARRVFVAVNSQTLDLSPGSWTYEERERRLVLRTELVLDDSPLEPGLNIVECSVMDGVDQLLRVSCGFVLDPNAGDLGDGLRVMGDLSSFDAPGDDHRNLAQEYVVLGNEGSAPISMLHWRMSDRVGHTFEFPDVHLAPGETLRVHTGRTAPGGGLVWGRGQAVWNNRGDTVYLFDPNRVLRHEHVY